jgi:hypothetical protein
MDRRAPHQQDRILGPRLTACSLADQRSYRTSEPCRRSRHGQRCGAQNRPSRHKSLSAVPASGLTRPPCVGSGRVLRRHCDGPGSGRGSLNGLVRRRARLHQYPWDMRGSAARAARVGLSLPARCGGRCRRYSRPRLDHGQPSRSSSGGTASATRSLGLLLRGRGNDPRSRHRGFLELAALRGAIWRSGVLTPTARCGNLPSP